MSFAYPIYAILMYLSILFAPPGTDRITIDLPGGEPAIELVRDGQKWNHKGNAVSIEKDSLVVLGEGGKESFKITDFVALPVDHDWSKNPRFTLGGGNVLEKVATGFTMRRNAPEGEGNGGYQIRYHKPVTVNVLGEVVNQGAHAIRADGTAQDAITAAGGPSPIADMKHVSIIRGAAGTVPEVTTVDLEKADAIAPNVQTGDTVHVAKKDDPKSAIPDIRLVGNWLEKIDHRDMGQAWDMAAEFFQSNVTREQWEALATAARKPLGSMKSRRLISSMALESLPGAPDGIYQVYEFESSFDNKKVAKEVVTFAKEKDGTWKPAGYFIE